MALRKCKECGKEVSTKATSCPNCGAPVKAPGPKKYGCLSSLLIIGGTFLVVTLIAMSLNRCVSEQSRESASKQSRNSAPQQSRSAAIPDQYYVRIGFSHERGGKPLAPKCRMWIRGYGDFYPTRQEDWRFGGTLIEKAGPFSTSETQTLFFYPYYTNEDEGLEIKVPFRFSKGMRLGAPVDMISIVVKPNSVEFFGTPISNANGSSVEVER